MYQKHGPTHIFRADWAPRNFVVLAWVCAVPCFILFGFAIQSPDPQVPIEEQLFMMSIIGLFIMIAIWLLWTYIIPVAKKAIVMQVDPVGISSDYYLRGATIRWSDLLDIKFDATGNIYISVGAVGNLGLLWGVLSGINRLWWSGNLGAATLKITLVLRENSPSWLALPRKWIFWRSKSIDIALTPLPAEEQVQAALALRAAFARYGGETAYQLMRGIRQEQMAEAFEELAFLPSDLRHPDFSLPPRDAPNAKP